MNDIDVKIQMISEKASVPHRATDGSAGYDVYACLEQPVQIGPGNTEKIPLGFKTSFPYGYVALIFARSGLSIKNGLAPANKVGVIDADYRGEWIVALYNQSTEVKTIEPGDRIAQVVFVPYYAANFIEVEELDNTERGEGGFNSTGTK